MKLKRCVHHADTGDVTMQEVWEIMNLIANEGRRILEKGNSREIKEKYARLDLPTWEPVANFGCVLQQVQMTTTMDSYAPYARVVESTSSLFKSCGMMLIWVRVEVDPTGDLEHANMIVFITKKSDMADEIDHS